MRTNIEQIKEQPVSVSPIAAELERQRQIIDAVGRRTRELEERLLVVSHAIEAPASVKEEKTECVLCVTGRQIMRANDELDLLCEIINSMILRLEI